MKLAILILVATAAAAHADCKPTGDTLFEIGHDEGIADGRSSAVMLYRNGAWTLYTTNGELAPQTTAGCLDAKTLATIAKHVDSARWTVTTRKGAVCHARSTDITTFLRAGKVLWTDETCSVGELDADSSAHLAAIVKTLTDATPKHF